MFLTVILQSRTRSFFHENNKENIFDVQHIDATARTAVDLGFETTVIEDACATLELSYYGHDVPAEQIHYSFIGALNGMYAEIISTEDFLK